MCHSSNTTEVRQKHSSLGAALDDIVAMHLILQRLATKMMETMAVMNQIIQIVDARTVKY